MGRVFGFALLVSTVVASIAFARAGEMDVLKERVDALVSGEKPLRGAAAILVKDGRTYFYSAGQDRMTETSIVEIGSNTKVFVSLLLAKAVQSGRLDLDDHVNAVWGGTLLPEAIDRSINLRHLATHASGLPRLPASLDLNSANPYATYSEEMLGNDMARLTPRNPESGDCLQRDEGEEQADVIGNTVRKSGVCYLYSNLAVAVLGEALAKNYGGSFGEVLTREILSPMSLTDTVLELGEEQRGRVVQGHNADGNPVGLWDFLVTAPAGALRSTPADMAKFIAFQLSPSDELSRAVTLARESQSTLPVMGKISPAPTLEMALGWHLFRSNGATTHWHGGGTSGFSSFTGMDVERRMGIFVISNQYDDRVALTGLQILQAL